MNTESMAPSSAVSLSAAIASRSRGAGGNLMESLIEAISTLDLDSKEKLLELLEQQIFAAEETSYEEDPQTIAEIKAVQTEYEAGEYIAFDQYLENRLKQAL